MTPRTSNLYFGEELPSCGQPGCQALEFEVGASRDGWLVILQSPLLAVGTRDAFGRFGRVKLRRGTMHEVKGQEDLENESVTFPPCAVALARHGGSSLQGRWPEAAARGHSASIGV